MSELPREAEAFLRDLERSLSPLPPEERREVVAELRSHLADRLAQGAADPLAAFGRPEEYAAAFLAERALSGALARGGSWSLSRALLAGARRIGWWYAVAVLWLVQLLGLALVLLAAAKLVLPRSVGLFLGPHALTLGMIVGEPPPGPELLGWWGLPVFLALGVLALWSARWALRTLAAWRLDRLRAARAA